MTKKVSPKSASESMVESYHIVLPSHANALGTIFGGTVMSWIDVSAAICAQRHSRLICVTASVDALSFLAPARVGDTVQLRAKVVHTGRTSMMIYVDVRAEDYRQEDRRKCVDAYLTFVALNEQNQPAAVPPLLLETDEEKREFAAAAQRRESLIKQKR